MAVIQTIELPNHAYTVANDRTYAYQALVVGKLVDEITGKSLKEPFSLKVSFSELDVKILSDGLFCIATRPSKGFPKSDSNYELTLAFQARGYKEKIVPILLTAGSEFPIEIPDVKLRRSPIRLQGRVVEDTTTRSPIANARVNAGPPGNPTDMTQNVIILRTPLYFDHFEGVQVQTRQLDPILTSPIRQIIDPVTSGQRIITLSRRDNLTGAILHLSSSEKEEYVTIEQVIPIPTDLRQAGKVLLAHDLQASYPAMTQVEVLTLGAVGTTVSLEESSYAGESLLVIDGVLTGDIIEVNDPLLERREYHAIGAFTNSAGFYHFDGISNIEALNLVASRDGASRTAGLTINYSQHHRNVVNFRL